MNIGVYGILIIFGIFIILFIFNPNLSCFGRKIKSPFYPILRKRRQKARRKQIPTQDYGLDLGGPKKPPVRNSASDRAAPPKGPPVEDYGFRLSEDPPPGRGIKPDAEGPQKS